MCFFIAFLFENAPVLLEVGLDVEDGERVVVHELENALGRGFLGAPELENRFREELMQLLGPAQTARLAGARSGRAPRDSGAICTSTSVRCQPFFLSFFSLVSAFGLNGACVLNST